ncbi:hypothetical protein BV22DRAFT_729347 [Leucogyrophana mollusca]|uniref:Uncharacterized protein n=1 Tax=Leucogyrophana mollusca TaxID=85980 RepID=A0ACB8B7D9_9AGAM|nr:hypothetical protein BV22DRAFT_729347 [Leucogyrophana mollusca]
MSWWKHVSPISIINKYHLGSTAHYSGSASLFVVPSASMTHSPELSFLDLVNKCDNFRLPAGYGSDSSTELIPWTLSPSPNSPVVGLLWTEVVQLLKAENEANRASNKTEIWVIQQSNADHSRAKRVSFHASIDTPAERTAVLKELCERWRDTGLFADIIGPKKWREETLLGPNNSLRDGVFMLWEIG